MIRRLREAFGYGPLFAAEAVILALSAMREVKAAAKREDAR